MKLLLILLLVQSLPLPPRAAMENPAVVSPIPPKLKKDYDKFWARFTAAADDAKLVKDLDNVLKKQKNFDALLMIKAYIDLFKANGAGAVQTFEQALAINPDNRIAQYYLAELAFANGDYARASVLYTQLLAADRTRTDLEMKRQKAHLQATENLLRSAAQAESENRLADAEAFYRQALNIVPNEPLLRLRLADLLTRANKMAEAAVERKIAEGLMPRKPGVAARSEEAKVNELEDLGRWGNDIDLFHQIKGAESLTRERFATLIVRYFPQITELRQNSQIVTDIGNSPAVADIHTVLGIGLMDLLPNHTFEPSTEVTRGDFAVAMARLIRLLGLSATDAPPLSAPDLASTNAQYADVQLVVGYGLMKLQDEGYFNVAGKLSGQEAVDAAERLLRSFQQAQR